MEAIKKKYLVNEKNQKIGVQLDIETFHKMEEILENYALFKLMNENDSDDRLDIVQARKFYGSLEKAS
jgi:hypothetical protein